MALTVGAGVGNRILAIDVGSALDAEAVGEAAKLIQRTAIFVGSTGLSRNAPICGTTRIEAAISVLQTSYAGIRARVAMDQRI
jgi:hypothetical protein